MKNRSILFLSGILLSAAAYVPSATAQVSGECPNVQATPVDARTEGLGGSERCGLGVSLFGWSLGLFGPSCPDKKATYPAHSVCRGEKNMGTRCVKVSNLRVTLEECECSVAGVLGTGLSLPSCSCTPSSADGGVVENFETQNCVPEV